jgi:nucleoid DNA-binding protein
MTLTKNNIVREIGRRTRLKNREVQAMLEALVEVWTEELIRDGRIELENLFVLETRIVDRGQQTGMLKDGTSYRTAPRTFRRLTIRASKRLKRLLNSETEEGR